MPGCGGGDCVDYVDGGGGSLCGGDGGGSGVHICVFCVCEEEGGTGLPSTRQ